MEKTLLVLLGPTGVGKTALSIELAKRLKTEIISSDSRQIYKGMVIGTAAPTTEEMDGVTHHFIQTISPETYYSASEYETDVLQLLQKLFLKHQTVIMTGGSMMYIDAVCKGIDDIPTIDETLRKELYELYESEGIDSIRSQLRILDPVFYNQVDLKNHKRVIHALEVCLMSGKPYSSLRTGNAKERDFKIIKIGLTRDREELYDRINQRVDAMVQDGLIEEAERLYPLRHLNSLNTVGYKELFDYFDGKCTKEESVDRIKQHSRNYARKQMTWFKRDEDIIWYDLSNQMNQETLLNSIIDINP